MTRFNICDRVVVNSPVKQEYKGQIGKVISVDLIEWEDTKVIEAYIVEFPDRSLQIFVGVALVPYSQAPLFQSQPLVLLKQLNRFL
jgi:hypothetical protein